MKKHAATLFMVALAAALGLWLWLDRSHVTTSERRQRENSVFSAWRRDELSAITLAHEGETLVLARGTREGQRDLWRMTSPREERADGVAVDRLLATLELATIARKVGGGSALGLESPRATGTLRMGALVVPFALGGASPRPEGSGYLRVGEEAPVVVSRDVVEALLAPADTYRDRTVVPYLPTELARFQVAHPGGGFALERIDERSFRVSETGVLAARAALERMWAALAEMRAEAFPADADAERLTAEPVLTLTMTPSDGKQPPAEIVIGAACPGHPADVVVLRKRPSRVAACAPKDVAAALLADAASLAERHPFTLRMDEIEELRLERTGAPAGAAPSAIELARKGVGFHQRAPEDRDLAGDEADAAGELVTRIAEAEAETVTRGGAPFTPAGRARIRSGEHEQVVEIGPLDGKGGAVLRRVLDDARLVASPALVRRLLPRETSLRPRAIVTAETRRATRVVLRCGVEQELVDRGEGFRMVSPAGYEADASVSQLVDAVLRGKADAWVADADDGSFGLSPEGCRVILGFEDNNAPLTLWLGSEGEGGIYGRDPARPGVFVLPRALRELAGRIYVSRGSLRAEPSRIEHVRATFEGRPVAGDPSALREAVAGLYAERVVSLGKRAPTSAPLAPGSLVIEVALTEGGAPRRIACGPSTASAERLCTASGVEATFAVAASRLALFIARDAGAR